MSDNKNRVVFLDIDGPIINTGCYSVDKQCSLQRSVMNQSAIGWVNKLCREINAYLVTNSTHSHYLVEDRTLKDDLIRFGADPSLFHDDWRTSYPDKLSGGSRLGCIGEWIDEHPGLNDWVAFDDMNFTDSRRLIVVDFDDGITYRHYSKALKQFGVRQKLIV
jgi:hypothetical protein